MTYLIFVYCAFLNSTGEKFYDFCIEYYHLIDDPSYKYFKLPVMDITASDPYVKIKCGSQRVGQTTVKLRNLNPVWNETFLIPLLHLKETLLLKVFDEDHGKEHDIMGVVTKDIPEACEEIRAQGKLTSSSPTSFRMPLKLNDVIVKGELFFSILLEVSYDIKMTVSV